MPWKKQFSLYKVSRLKLTENLQARFLMTENISASHRGAAELAVRVSEGTEGQKIRSLLWLWALKQLITGVDVKVTQDNARGGRDSGTC